MQASTAAPDRVVRFIFMSMLAASAVLLPVTGLSAEYLPFPQDIATQSEQALLAKVLSRFSEASREDSADALHQFDEALVQLKEPTPLRGLVQFFRANILFGQDKDADAALAIDESMRLLPSYSGPLLLASRVHAYSDRPGMAADFLLRASTIDPDVVREFDEYDLSSLLHRLEAKDDQRRLHLVSERLLEIGWIGEGLELRSWIALKAIEGRMAVGDVAGARTLVPKLLVPNHSHRLLVANSYRELWPDIEQWAGSKLEKQWRIYLGEAREKWRASRDVSTVRDYVAILAAAGHDRTVIAEMLPLFSSLDKLKDHDLIFVASPLAGALARAGRWDDVERIFSQAQEVWPLGEQANALNIAANRARFLFYRGKTNEALELMDQTIAQARKWQGEVNSNALVIMHHYRACMLHQLGRVSEAGLSVAIALSGSRPEARARLHLCLDQPDRARQVMLDALTKEGTRNDVLSFMQPIPDNPVDSDFGRKTARNAETLRRDPKLVAEAAKHGRVLTFSLEDGAPREELSIAPVS